MIYFEKYFYFFYSLICKGYLLCFIFYYYCL
nr:MAG TPA: hypothetical protein [Caudoviricetes sp.]